MMNRQITQWHNPRDCTSACMRVENVMQKLKDLARSIDEGDGGYRRNISLPRAIQKVKTEPPELPCQPMRPHYRYPEALGDVSVPNCRCAKRNGLQDKCGDLGKDCYMNPKAVFNAREHHNMGGEPMYSYQRESNTLRCREDGGMHHHGSYRGESDGHGSHRRGCTGPGCVNDFYLVPVERQQ
ncbi:uncharacterized protein [Halyomorpha halys]|uniref:uncharacterized protein n=1 Tax=Halyomorpha halys TaxID=286706 RepID=UPI0006D518BC|nr:uncharacterized protein LOC106688936 [Halyomorpha halys]